MYSRDLLRLGLRLAEQARLSESDGTAEARSRTCGSVMTADVRMDGDRVAGFGQDVKACAVGQASAAVLGSHIVGRKRTEIKDAHDRFANFLSGSSDDLGDWPELRALAGVREQKGRHAAALLPFEAALAAIDQAVSRSKNPATSES